MIDELIVALSTVSKQLLPILGAAVLIFLIVFLRRCIRLIEECTNRIKQLESTVKGVDRSIEKIQAPLDTAVKVSHSVDKVHDSTEAALKQAVSYVASNLGTIKDSLIKGKPESDEKQEAEESGKEEVVKTEGEDQNV